MVTYSKAGPIVSINNTVIMKANEPVRDKDDIMRDAMKQDTEMSEYFSGARLYGDNFTLDEIKAWYADEKEGFTDLYVRDASYDYKHHALNAFHGYRYLPKRQFDAVLGLGSATGEEFSPILPKIKNLTILEPSDLYEGKSEINGVPCRYVKPGESGDMPFKDNQFDLIVALGVLHHIPNVSHVIKECGRCLAPGGGMLLREPIISMGDWRKVRPGLTKHERGIPAELLGQMIEAAELSVVREAFCAFSPLSKLCAKLGFDMYNNRFLVAIDAMLSRSFAWNYRYHAENFLQKFRPTSAYFVLRHDQNVTPNDLGPAIHRHSLT